MENRLTLPEGYGEILEIDLQKQKKLAFWINGLSLVSGVLLTVIGCLFVPVTALFDFTKGYGMYMLRFVVMCLGLVAYIILHELVHGIFLKHYSGVKPHYGFTGMYAYAGSNAYFNKKSYCIIALSPIVVWGLVLTVLCVLAPEDWFWVVYLIQVINLSGAAGDLYVTVRFSRLSEDILIQDTGVSMRVYSRRG